MRSYQTGALVVLAISASCSAAPTTGLKPQRLPVRILSESFALGGSVQEAWLATAPDGSYELRVEGAQGLRALYVEAEVDPRCALVAAEFTEALASGSEALGLALSPGPGRLVIGQVIAHPLEQPGLRGAAVIARLRLSPRAAQKQASLPPQLPAAETALHLDMPSATLDWLYHNPGDYDQNSEVNIADLTPLGLHFGELGPFDITTALSVIDGDGNGEINIADITTIGQCYGRACGGYKIYMSLSAADVPASPSAPSTIDDIGTASSTLGSAGIERLQYLFSLGQGSVPPSAFYWVRPFDGPPQGNFTEGTPSTVVDVGALQANLPPVATIEADTLSGPPGLLVLFDANGSTDPDGTVEKYRWDPDGDGTYNIDITNGSPNIAHTYSFPGTYQATVKVFDDLGASATASVEISISLGTQEIETVDPDLTSLSFPGCMALIDGAPAVVYCADSGEVRYARATSAAASTWTAPRTLDSGVTTTVALAEVSGNPAAVWTGNGGLCYRRAADAHGDVWPPTQIIAADIGPLLTGFAPDLAVISGNPAVSYTDSSGGLGGLALYKRATDASGSVWGSEVPVALGGEFGYSGALGEFAGAPCVLYANDVVDTKVHFARGADGTGGSFQSPLILDSASDAAINTSSLLLSSSRLLAVYWSSAQGALLCCRSTDPSGTEWEEPRLICEADALNSGFTAALVNGLPVVAFHSAPAGLAYAIGEVGGSAWNQPLTLVPGANLGFVPAVQDVGGLPVICYLDLDAGELRCLHFN